MTFPALPAGPHRELLLFLFELHRLAGEPATRAIADGVVESAEQRVRCSHTTVHKLLTGHQLPTNGDLVFEIAKWLNSRNRHRPQDEEVLLDRLEALWRAAQRYEALAPPELRTAPRVFISYAHDSAEHRDSVVRLAQLLMRNGVDVSLDQWEQGVRRDWARWTMDQLVSADFVLVVASPGYRYAADSARGRGASFEAAALRESLQRDPAVHFRRILSVLLPGGSVDDIPLFLQPYLADHYRVTDFTAEGVEDLLRVLTSQPAIARPSVAAAPALAPVIVPAREAADAIPIASKERSTLLPDLATSRAVLTGVAGYRLLPALSQVASGVGEMRRLLTAGPEPAFRADHASVLVDPVRTDLLDAVAEAVDQAEDTLLLYFAGHGLVSSRRGDLLLATVDTRPEADYTAVQYDSVRDLLSGGRARRSVVILDCCFSGRALESMGHLDGLAEVPGTFVLTATSGNAATFAPADRPYPVFTAALVDVLANGEPGGSEYLTVDRIYQGVRRRALEQGFPVPQRMARGDRDLALARNAAFRPRLSAGTELRRLTGHTGTARGVCVIRLADRDLLASASDDRTVRIWDPTTGTQLHQLTGHTDAVTGVAAMRVADRDLLASASNDRTVRIWDPATGILLVDIPTYGVGHALTSVGADLAVGLDTGLVSVHPSLIADQVG